MSNREFDELYVMIRNPNTKNASLLQKIRSMRYASSLSGQQNGITLLIWLCQFKHREPVALALLETGHARPKFVTSDGGSALLFACVHDMAQLALAILNRTGGAEAENVFVPDGQTAFLGACKNGMKEVAMRLLHQGHALPEVINRKGESALLLACSQKKMTDVAMAMIPLLVASGHADVIGHANSEGETALLWACYNNKEELALRLIETQHANLAQSNQLGDTALITASFNELKAVVTQLLQDRTAPTYVNHVDLSGFTALYYMMFQYLNKKPTPASVAFFATAVMEHIKHRWILSPSHEPVIQELCELGSHHPHIQALMHAVRELGGDPTSLENLCLPIVSTRASRASRTLPTAQRQRTLRTHDLARSMVLSNRRQTQRVHERKATYLPVVHGYPPPRQTFLSVHHSRGERMPKPL